MPQTEKQPPNMVGSRSLDPVSVYQLKPEVLFSRWLGGDFPADATDCYAINAQYLNNLKKEVILFFNYCFPVGQNSLEKMCLPWRRLALSEGS